MTDEINKRTAELLEEISKTQKTIDMNINLLLKILFPFVVLQGFDVSRLLDKDLTEIHAELTEHLNRRDGIHQR